MRTYNRGWRIEQQFRDIKDRPLGLRPIFLTNDDQITGMTNLLTLALRIMTLIKTVVRRSLEESGEELVGLYPGQKSRSTARPTARLILRAFHRYQLTLTRIRGPDHDIAHIDPLPPNVN